LGEKSPSLQGGARNSSRGDVKGLRGEARPDAKTGKNSVLTYKKRRGTSSDTRRWAETCAAPREKERTPRKLKSLRKGKHARAHRPSRHQGKRIIIHSLKEGRPGTKHRSREKGGKGDARRRERLRAATCSPLYRSKGLASSYRKGTPSCVPRISPEGKRKKSRLREQSEAAPEVEVAPGGVARKTRGRESCRQSVVGGRGGDKSARNSGLTAG